MRRLTQWRTLIPPLKACGSVSEQAWSKRLESVRKDVECTFGILKGRFRILKVPIEYHSHDKIDNVFFSCCILHNMLHAIDGLETMEAGMHWSGEDGLLEHADRVDATRDHSRVGKAVDRLEVPEVETGFGSFRNQLIRHYTAERALGNVQWLVHSTTQ